MSIIIIVIIIIITNSPWMSVGMVRHSLGASVVLQTGGGGLDEALELRLKVQVYSRIGQMRRSCTTYSVLTS
jgi:hypothetical protein